MNEAVGVCGLIMPWNFPIAMITRKAGPALAAGCTVVLKPSNLTPLTAVALSVLAERAVIPGGMFKIVTVDQTLRVEVGEEMCSNRTVRKISFTGSTPVGKLLIKLSGDTVKQCICADRFIVHKLVEEEFVSKLANWVRRLNVGHGTKDGVTMGPVISAQQVKILKEKVDAAISKGSTCVVRGSSLAGLGLNYIYPSSSIWHLETFGPIAVVKTFDTEEEAITLANNTRTGLASYFFTRDKFRVFRVSAALKNGIVGINKGIIGSTSASGLGREGSVLGINEYLEMKYVFLNA